MVAAIADAVNRAVMVAIWIERVLAAAMVDDVMVDVCRGSSVQWRVQSGQNS